MTVFQVLANLESVPGIGSPEIALAFLVEKNKKIPQSFFNVINKNSGKKLRRKHCFKTTLNFT